MAPVTFHYVTRIFHTPVGAISTAVSLSKTHKFHSTIVIRYYARPRLRDTWLPVGTYGWSIVVIARRRRFLVFSEHGNTRESRLTLLYIRLSAHTYTSSPRRPLCFSRRCVRFFSPLVQTSFENGKKKMPEKGKNEYNDGSARTEKEKMAKKKLISNTMPKRTRRPF